MTNFEFYKDELLQLASEGHEIGLHNSVPVNCIDIECCNCDWDGNDCSGELIKWLYQEYEPHTDWNKIEVDTPIYVGDFENMWHRGYFAKYENGKVYAFQNGATSWTNNASPISWKYAKLKEVEE